MKVTNKITIHLDDARRLPPVDVMQGDANTRALELTLMAGGAPWVVPAGVSAAVAYQRSDGARGLYDTLSDGTSACTVVGNVVTVILVPQALATYGITEVTVVLSGNNGIQLATFCIIVRVERNPAIGAVEPEDYVKLAGNVYVTVTGDETEGYTSDMTHTQIAAAVAAGKTVWCKWDSVHLPLITIDDFAYFGTVTPYNGVPTVYTVDIDSDGVAICVAQELSAGSGNDGLTPYIGANGNWWIGEEDTGKPSRGATGQSGAGWIVSGEELNQVNASSDTLCLTPSGDVYQCYGGNVWGNTGLNIKGPQGEDGAPGADGKDGAAGPQGPAGANGISPTIKLTDIGRGTLVTISGANGQHSFEVTNGQDGAQGPVGPQGETGPTGAQGLQGEIGPQGPAGEPGPQGVAGPAGADGADGQDGQDGAPGADGKSAYQSYVDTGGGLTEAQWVASLAQTEPPEFVDSIDQMADQSKAYVLTTDGMIYTYGKYTTGGAATYTNLYIASEAQDNMRLNSSNQPASLTGSMLTDYIPVYNGAVIRVKGLPLEKTNGIDAKTAIFDSNKNSKNQITNMGDIWSKDDNGVYSATATSNNWGYIRISAAGSTADDIIITVDEEITSGPVEQIGWHSTGLAYVPADYEQRIIDLENQNTDQETRLIALEGNSDTSTAYPSYWDAAVAECISKIKALQVGRHCVTFPFFSDNHQRLGYAGAMIAKIMRECNIPYCFFGGDSISNGYIETEAEMIEQDRKFDTMMAAVPNGRLCRTVGNHDGWWKTSEGVATSYTRDQVYELFLREESLSQLKHFGEDGTYYYVDDIASKARFIVLNSNGGFGESQRSWVQDTALQFSESGWAVVFISHAPVTNNFHSLISDAQAMQGVLTGYINGSGANKADVVGWYAGHIHRDRIYQCDATGDTDADDQTTVGLPWKTVTITSDHTTISYDDATKHTVAADDQSHAIDFVTVNKADRSVHITRLGIGSDRSYTY